VQLGLDLLHNIADRLRLHAQEHDVSSAHGGTVVGRYLDTVLRRKRSGPLGVLHRGTNALSLNDLPVAEGLHENAAHFAEPKYGKVALPGFFVQSLFS